MARFHAPPVGQGVLQGLVDAGLMERASDPGSADVIVVGGSYVYLPAFWERAGAIVRDPGGGGWVVCPRTPEARERVRARIVEIWIAAGASPGWASMEADGAVDWLLVHGPPASRAEPAKVGT